MSAMTAMSELKPLRGLTPDHDVLTDLRGWAPISTITIADKVACLDPSTNALSYQYPREVRQCHLTETEMYSTRSPTTSLHTTLGHHLFARRLGRAGFERIEAQHAACRGVRYKHDAYNTQFDVPYFVCGDTSEVKIPMKEWILVYAAIRMTGKLIAPPKATISRDGGALRLKKKHWRRALSEHTACPAGSTFVRFTLGKDELVPALIGLDRAGVRYWQNHQAVIIESGPICAELAAAEIAGDFLHPFAWSLSGPQALLLLKALRALLLNPAPCVAECNAMQRLALHADLALTFNPNDGGTASRPSGSAAMRLLSPSPCDGPPALFWGSLPDSVRHAYEHLEGGESIRSYTGDVYGLTVPTGVYYVRRGGIPVWTCD